MRSLKSVGIVLVVVAILLSACVAPTPEVVEKTVVVEKPVLETVVVEKEVVETVVVERVVTPTSPPKRNVVTVAQSSAPISTLDPADHRYREIETVVRNMFDGLVTRDRSSGVHLQLAESYEWLDDATLQWKLREGVKFHDGVEMTADDVVFTFNRIIGENKIEYPDPHTSPRKGLCAPLESIEKTGDYTVVMHFTAPWPTALQLLVHQQILPKHYLEEVGTKGFLDHPIGTGPFKFVSASDSRDEVVMERFADYYGGSPDLEPVGPACVDKVIFRYIGEVSTRVAALLSGEVDIITGTPIDMIEILSETPGIQVKTSIGTSPRWLEMNVSKAPFDDVRVRQAMNYAVDVDTIIETLYRGRAERMAGPFEPKNNYIHPDLEPYPYSPEKALELLGEAGWTDSDGDGILDKGGEPFNFVLDSTDDVAMVIQGQLKEIGLDVKLRSWDWATLQRKLLAGERTAMYSGWGSSAFDPVGCQEAKWHVYQEGSPYGRGNYSQYNNPRVNELIEMGETTADSAERQKIYNEMQEIIYEECPCVPLFVADAVQAASSRLENWAPAADGRINLHDVCVSE